MLSKRPVSTSARLDPIRDGDAMELPPAAVTVGSAALNPSGTPLHDGCTVWSTTDHAQLVVISGVWVLQGAAALTSETAARVAGDAATVATAAADATSKANAARTGAVADIRNGVSSALDTLIEVAAQLAADESAAAALATTVAGKASKLAIVAPITTSAALAAWTHTPVDASAAALAPTLPTGQAAGTEISVEKRDASPNKVTVTGNIRGSAGTLDLTLQYQTVLFVADAAGSWVPVASHKTLGSLDARYARSSVRRLAVLGDKRNRRLFHDDGDLANNWTVTTGTGTVTAAADSPVGRGGKLVTLAAGGGTASMKIETNAASQPYPQGGGWALPAYRPFIATTEMTISSGGWCQVDLFEGVSNRYTLLFGFGGNQLTVNAAPVTLTSFDQTKRFRITMLVDLIANNVKLWMSYDAGHFYLGSTALAANSQPRQLRISPALNVSGVTVTVARTRVYEVYGAVNGCSTDSAYNSWADNPNTGNLATTWDEQGNTALALARRLNDGRDWYVNHAVGGYRVDQMLAEFNNFVMLLQPRIVVIGSATNSIAASFAAGDPAGYITQAKLDYLAMVNTALAAGCIVSCRVCDPRHDATFATPSSRLQASQQWNDWMRATLPPLGVSIADTYSALEDPSAPGQLVAWADSGDHVHPSSRAIQVKADIEHRAIYTLGAVTSA